MKASVIVLTKNEGEKIGNCLESVCWADEVILVDDYSTDDTIKIARKYGAKIYKRHLNNNFESQRNYALQKSKSEWNLFIDADEVVSSGLSDEIINLVPQNEKGYLIRRQDIFMGKKILGGESGGVWITRLGKKNAGKWRRTVHEYWEINGNKERLKNSLHHSPHPSCSRMISKINYYSDLHAIENKNEGKNSSLFKIIFYPIAKFISNFVFKRGLCDGTHGFVLAMAMSFHSFLSWGKMYLDDQKK